MAKTIGNIIHDIPVKEVRGNIDRPVSHVVYDSRQVQPGDVFVAMRGTKQDGHAFIPSVLSRGVKIVVCEKWPEEMLEDVTWILVEDSSIVLGLMASAFYDHPSHRLKVVGVTGTNGKTTTATLLYRLFEQLGYPSGLFSTVCNYVSGHEFPATHTTPDSVELQELMYQMVKAGCSHCFMEVSSHSAHQNRIAGIQFAGAIFTNITHDHLDYHGTFENYVKAKKKFFDILLPSAFALVNKDDRNGMVMLQNTRACQKTFALHSPADFTARVLESHFEGMQLRIGNRDVWTHLKGEFNAYNFLGVYAAAVLLGEDPDSVLEAMSQLREVRGRFEAIRSLDGRTAIVDYAHTPDALKNVLETIHQIRGIASSKIIGVVGAGGDRDRTKRPEMGHIAASMCDRLILTSDNPRSEDPLAIIDEIKAGIDSQGLSKTVVVENRKEAIRTACMMAQKEDVILIAGKGHETYQEIKGVKHHFDDREIVEEIFGLKRNS